MRKTLPNEIEKKISNQNCQGKFEILIVDNVKENLFSLKALLEKDDVIIHQATSGVQALELMMKHDFCLAFLDVQMPEMNGFELAEHMRGSSKTKSIPIIFVTAAAKEQHFSFKGYENGAVDFLFKPLDPFAVKSKVNVFIELYRQRMELKIQLDMNSDLVEDLNSSKQEADRANDSKTQFLANMSHEIRTPLGAILGFIDLLKNPKCTNEEKNNYMVIVERNSQHLLSLIDDILDLSKVESGKMTIENIEFPLAEILSDIISIKDFKAKEKGIKFLFNTSTQIPEYIFSDPVRLRQILSNVVGNAIKFTSQGQVELSIAYVNSALQFTVKDTGVGISKYQEEKLFKAFAQADASITRKFGGTGLGLILSRRLAEAMNGKLELIESKEGIGSTFLFEVKTALIPNTKMVGKEELLIKVIEPPDFYKNAQVLFGLKILLVEDSPDNQMLITHFLAHSGAQVTSASNGAEGVERAMAEEFDVLLMDIQMPILDGHEATKKLRHLKYAKPIIALTAHAMNEEQSKCIESGFTDFLAKPIRRDLLIEMLSRYNRQSVL